MSNTVPMSNTRRLLLLLIPLAALLGVIATSSPAGAAAADGTTITRQSVVGETFTCDGQVFTVTAGSFQVITHERLTPSGAYHVIVEGNAQGVKALGPTGATYQGPGGFWIEVNATPGATVATETDALHVIGQGSAPDFTVHGVVHTTVDANGNVTALVDHGSLTGSCIVPPQG
jgi:hypothetical protein